MSPAELDAARRPSGIKSVRVAAKGSSAVVYLYQIGERRFVAKAFSGKRTKADWHYHYPSAEGRARKVGDWFAALAERAAVVKDRKAPHKYEVGHILRASWGYDQTNIDFFEVVRVPGPYSIEVREIASIDVGGGYGGDSSKCAPQAGKFTGPAKLCRAYGKDSVRIDECRRASLWDMKPEYFSWGR